MLAAMPVTGDPELFRPFDGRACRWAANGFAKACASKACARSTSAPTGSQQTRRIICRWRNTLDRRFDSWPPNRAWVADLTYIAMAQGWLYLAVITNLASRRIVGWSMSERMKAGLVCQALRSAYGQCRPPVGLILHSDQCAQYANHTYRSLAADFGMQVSMSRRANAWDNAAIESFFKTLKIERIYQCRYETREQAKLDIVDWIEGFYTRQRLHSFIGYRTPMEVEIMLTAA